MRITQSMITENFRRNLMQNLKRLNDINDKLATGKKIRRPSDNPVGAALSIRLRRQLDAIEQYKSNAQTALTWMENTETALANTGEVLQRLNELAVQAANDTLTHEERVQILYEVRELKEQILREANSASVDNYLFGGYYTDKPPFTKSDDGSIELNPILPGTTEGVIEYNLGYNERVPINISGQDTFSDVFAAVETFETALENNDIEGINQAISDIKTAMSTVLKYRSQLGARINRLEATVQRLEINEIDYTKQLSFNEDVDLAEMITQLKMEESVYRASLSVGARIIQPTLVDFLR